MPNQLSFSVVISTFNRENDLRRCLESLNKQTFRDFEIIVVNGGDVNTVEKVAGDFPDLRIKIVVQDRKGLSAARNLGWINVKTDIVCLIDDDLVVFPEWLENIRGSFSSDENIGGVSGPTIIPEDKQASRDLVFFLKEFMRSKNIFLKFLGKIYIGIILENKITGVGRILNSGTFTPGSNYKACLELSGLVEVDYLEACHMCFRRFLLERCGGFDYVYIGTGEWAEPDLCFKIKKLGYRLVFNPLAISEHRISQSGVFKARTNAYERSKNFIYFYFKWIKPDTRDKLLRFSLNLLFINLYWVYKFLLTGNFDWLSGITGTLSGLRQQICGDMLCSMKKNTK